MAQKLCQTQKEMYEDYYPLECYATQSGTQLPIFWKKLLLSIFSIEE